MDQRERVTIEPQVLAGKPAVRGTRLAVEFIVELPAAGWTEPELLVEYPGLRPEDVRACLAYVRDVLKSETVLPLAR